MTNGQMVTSGSSDAGGLGGVVFIVFLILKLVGVIGWSWWWVTVPLWGPVALVLAIMAVAAVILGLGWLFCR